MKLNNKITSLLPLAVLITLSLTACEQLDNGYSRPYDSGYSSPYDSGGGYYGNDRYDSSREYDRARRERERAEEERRAAEEEHRRAEEDRRHSYEPPPPPIWQRPSQPVQQNCPSGFSPSEQKCSPEERRRGCKDIRLNSGLGCVRR